MSFVEEDHWENARPFLETHAETFGQLSGGNQAHQLPVPKPLPHELAAARGDRTIVLALHYPPPGSPGYLTSTGDATDATTRALASAVNKAFQEHHLRFAQTFDVIVDLYDGPHDFKVDGRDFNFETHFFDKLSPEEQQAWWETKVGTLVGIIVDEIVQRGRKGADVLAMGVLPRKWWPELLAAAVPLAREQARTILGLTYLPPYDIAYPSTSGGQLPPLTRDEETGRAPSCGDKEIQHPCGAFSFMSVDHRARLDAGLQWLHRHILGAHRHVVYFRSLTPKFGDYSEVERRRAQADAKVRFQAFPRPATALSIPGRLGAGARGRVRGAAARRARPAADRGGGEGDEGGDCARLHCAPLRRQEGGGEAPGQALRAGHRRGAERAARRRQGRESSPGHFLDAS